MTVTTGARGVQCTALVPRSSASSSSAAYSVMRSRRKTELVGKQFDGFKIKAAG
ncbi:MAG: hypothetical protein MZV70_77320 [Desulfobacterales bacterium]|nr:hypothetical protein [Desulfobacterales bacterium]